ncbi:MAG: hypothetical protein JWO28_1799 [Hyphomicrobiales bacterium]|nr:hypothetical protein [Hyphomicrobiales bacterium]
MNIAHERSKDDAIIPYEGLRGRLEAVEGMGELLRVDGGETFANINFPKA